MDETNDTTSRGEPLARPPEPEPPAQPAPEPPAQPAQEPPPHPEPAPAQQPDPLAAALKLAADALARLAIATEREIVPELIKGDTPEQVQASIEASKAAYRAAMRHIQASLPPAPPPAPPTTPEDADPLTMITKGLRKQQ